MTRHGKTQLSFYVDNEIHEEMKSFAQHNELSLTELLVTSYKTYSSLMTAKIAQTIDLGDFRFLIQLTELSWKNKNKTDKGTHGNSTVAQKYEPTKSSATSKLTTRLDQLIATIEEV